MKKNNSDKAVDREQVSEKQVLSNLDHMLEGIQIIGFDWRYIYVNNAMTKHGKYSKDELIGYTVMEKYPGIEQTEVYKVYERCYNERVPIHMENRFVFPDKSVGWFELSFQPVPEGIFILSIDITERKKAEEELRKLNEELEQKVKERTIQLELNIQQLKESQEKFQKAFEGTAAGITITRLSDYTYIEVNNAFIEITGYSRDELINHTSVELNMVADFNRRDEVLQQVRETGSAKNFEISVRHKSGRMLHVLSSVETILLGGEKYAINIIYDISDRKRVEEKLETVNRELEAFSYSVSHDLRAPLRIINGYAEILDQEHGKLLDDEGKRITGIIINNAVRMGNLIDDLLKLSQFNKAELVIQPVEMGALVDSVLNELHHHNKYKNADIKAGIILPANCDHVLIRQVWMNLISNALKYSSKKEIPRIEIGSNNKDSEVVYFVSDNGAGFDMQYSTKLFGVFQRLHKSKDYEGTGVGLAIVHRIISRHHGKVWVEAEENKGATFYFSLPA